MSEIRELINDTVPVEEVLKHLDLGLGKNGRRLLGACPTGHSAQGEGCFSVNAPEGFFHCFHCGIAADVIDLVELVLGLEHKEALRWLADRFRPDLLNRLRRDGHGTKPDLKAYYQRASLYDLVFEYGKPRAGPFRFPYRYSGNGTVLAASLRDAKTCQRSISTACAARSRCRTCWISCAFSQ